MAFTITVGMVVAEIWRIRQIAYHNVDASRLWTLADIIYYALYVPDQLILLLGSKPFLDFNSHHVGYGNEYTAILLIVVVGTLFYAAVALLVLSLLRITLRRWRRSGVNGRVHR